MKIVCPTCKGKGHVVDVSVMIFVPVISWLIGYIERNDKDSTTRESCKTCKGKGALNL